MRSGERVAAFAVTAAIIGASAANAAGSTRAFVPRGGFDVPGGPAHGPLVGLFAVDHGKALGPGTTVTCTTSASPPDCLRARAGVMLRIAQRVKITRQNTFSYSGQAAVYVLGPIGGTDVSAQLSLKGRFAREHGSPFATGIKGTFFSSVCSSMTRFSSL
jgi:hypothetical protein